MRLVSKLIELTKKGYVVVKVEPSRNFYRFVLQPPEDRVIKFYALYTKDLHYAIEVTYTVLENKYVVYDGTERLAIPKHFASLEEAEDFIMMLL